MYDQSIYDELFESGFDAIGFAAGMGIYMLVMSLIGLALYILGSLGTYSIAKRRNIRHAWLSWLPIGNSWIWGCISDQYRYITRGQVTNRRKVLLGLSIAQYAPVIAMVVLYVKLVIAMVIPELEHMGPVDMQEDLGTVMLMMLVALVTVVLSVVLLVFLYMALYDLYRSCDPDNAVLFLVLSILFSNFTNIFIFAVRKKDLGMPPRRSIDQESYRPYEQ